MTKRTTEGKKTASQCVHAVSVRPQNMLQLFIILLLATCDNRTHERRLVSGTGGLLTPRCDITLSAWFTFHQQWILVGRVSKPEGNVPHYATKTSGGDVNLPAQQGDSAEAGEYRCCRDPPTCSAPSSRSPPSSLDAGLPHPSCSGCSTPTPEPPGPRHLRGQESAPQTLHRWNKRRAIPLDDCDLVTWIQHVGSKQQQDPLEKDDVTLYGKIYLALSSTERND